MFKKVLRSLSVLSLALVLALSLAVCANGFSANKAKAAELSYSFISAPGTGSSKKFATVASGSGVYYSKDGGSISSNANGLAIANKTAIVFEIAEDDTTLSFVTYKSGSKTLSYVVYQMTEANYTACANATSSSISNFNGITGGTSTLTGSLTFSTEASYDLGVLDAGYYAFYVVTGDSSSYIKSIVFTTQDAPVAPSAPEGYTNVASAGEDAIYAKANVLGASVRNDGTAGVRFGFEVEIYDATDATEAAALLESATFSLQTSQANEVAATSYKVEGNKIQLVVVVTNSTFEAGQLDADITASISVVMNGNTLTATDEAISIREIAQEAYDAGELTNADAIALYGVVEA